MTYLDILVAIFQVLTGPVVVGTVGFFLGAISLPLIMGALDQPWYVRVISAVVLVFGILPFLIWVVAEINPATYWQPL